MKASVLYLITVSQRVGVPELVSFLMGSVKGIGYRWGNEASSLFSGFNIPALEYRVGLVNCTLWLFLFCSCHYLMQNAASQP